MNNRDYMLDAPEMMKQLKKGVFLTVKAGDAVNTMTIGWGAFGFVWQKKVLMIAVRDSRHTYTLLEKTDNFTVSFPAGKAYKDSVMFCGTKSGRDFDKFKECGLSTRPALHVQSPIIDIPGIHYECSILCKTPMDPSLMAGELDGLYPQKDYHTLYFGEVLACYETA